MITIESYRGMLPVNKHRLDDELEIQPDIMDRIATQVVIRNSRMIGAKEELAKVEGRLVEDLRDGDTKTTIGVIDAKIKRDPGRIRAWQEYQKARSEHEEWAGLLDAWKQKGYAIKTLADLYAAQYFTLNSHQISQRQRQRDEASDDLRASMRKAGHTTRHVHDDAQQVPTKPSRRTIT